MSTLPALRGTETTASERRPFRGGYRIFHIDHLSYDQAQTMRGAFVASTEWGVSYTLGAHIDGAILNVHRVTFNPLVVTKHDLDGGTYPSRDDASRAAYEAGLLGYMVYEDHRMGLTA